MQFEFWFNYAAKQIYRKTEGALELIELFEHNKIAYEAVLEQLADTRKVCVIHPTGTGKSFIAFKWAEMHPHKCVLWISPSENIYETQKENVKRASNYEPENITFITYARLANLTDSELDNLNPSLICLDEMHRAGAPVWYIGVKRLLKAYPDALLLGLTATPIRYLDNQRDMAQELFDDNVADSMTLGEAIARGILPTPKYVICLYRYDKSLSHYDKEFKYYKDRIRRSSAAVRAKAEDYLEKLRRALQMANGLEVVFKKHLTRGKYIAFCADVDHMKEMLTRVPEWFSGVDDKPHVYSVWADSASAKSDYAAFREDGSKHLRLLFCVDMFNEGIHVEDIDGVILFRPTISPIIYKQQIGRALSAMKDGIPLIIDAVNNFENLYSISSIQSEMHEFVNFYLNTRRENEIEADAFEIIDEVRECRQLIDQLEETLSLSWEAMYGLAKTYYKTYGNLNMERRYRTAEGVPLGQWIATQRNVYNCHSAGMLNEYRIRLLNEIGMEWDYARDLSWEKGFSHLMVYKETYGCVDIQSHYICEDGFQLGKWISTQRSTYMMLRNAGRNPLEDERLKRLNDLGMIWKQADAAFEEGLLEATKFAAEHGDLEVPAKYVSDNGFKLGAWIGRMRYRYTGYRNNAPLDEDQIKRLEALGMQWQSKYDRKWELCFAEADRYYKLHGNLKGPRNYTQNGVNLFVWVKRQVKAARDGKLPEEKLRRLEQIGFTIPTREKTWEENFAQALVYYEQNGNLEIPKQYVAPNGTWLGKWISMQRLNRKQGRLSDEQITKLNKLSMRWEDEFVRRWKANLRMASTYPRTVDGVPIIPDDTMSEFGTKLCSWVQLQDRKYHQGKLKAEQRKRWEEMLRNGR
ncbi:MAG: Helicase associated domain protein [Parasporobacterium sp.]|nr:Helicase associated domain protein [Parasporobacterium sp.]